jgi:hypothetical protein
LSAKRPACLGTAGPLGYSNCDNAVVIALAAARLATKFEDSNDDRAIGMASAFRLSRVGIARRLPRGGWHAGSFGNEVGRRAGTEVGFGRESCGWCDPGARAPS